jgi:transposase
MLRGYKGQVQVERGFRYLKDPRLLADSLYLQSERRIMASLMIMTLCLLVCESRVWARMDYFQPSSYSLRPSPSRVNSDRP